MRLRRARREKELQPEVSGSDAEASLACAESPSLSPSPGTVLGLQTRTQDFAPPINEWGFYDPEVCGFNALFASLDKVEHTDAEPADEDPAELLLRQDEPPLGLPVEEIELDGPPPNGDAACASPAAAVASCRVPHFAPLALWAHVTDSDAESCGAGRETSRVSALLPRLSSRWSPLRLPTPVCDDLAALIGRLTLPAQFVVTGAPGGCRIRDVHIAPAAGDDYLPAGDPECELEEFAAVVETDLALEVLQPDPLGDAPIPSDTPDLALTQPQTEAPGQAIEIPASETAQIAVQAETPTHEPPLSFPARWARVAMALG